MSVPAPQIPVLQQDVSQNAFGMDDNNMVRAFSESSIKSLLISLQFGMGMDFTNPSLGSADVLQDFDFDSFLHQDAGENDTFGFDTSGYMESEVGAE